jgi:hypothetical protein
LNWERKLRARAVGFKPENQGGEMKTYLMVACAALALVGCARDHRGGMRDRSGTQSGSNYDRNMNSSTNSSSLTNSSSGAPGSSTGTSSGTSSQQNSDTQNQNQNQNQSTPKN